MKTAIHLALAVGVLAIGSGAHAQPTYTNIADTSGGQFANFGHFQSAEDGVPALNNLGTIAFWAATNAGPQGFYTRTSGGSVTTIVDNSGSFAGFSTSADFTPRRVAINDSGAVAFFANTGSVTGIYAGGGGTVTTIADTTRTMPLSTQNNPWGGFSNKPSINNNGQVAFTGIEVGGANTGLFTGTGGAPTTVASNNSMPGAFAINASSGNTSINNSGVIAVHANTGDGNDFQRIYRGSSSPLTVIASPVGPPLANNFGSFGASTRPVINASGNVAFVAQLDAGGTGVFRGNGGSPTTIADSNGPYQDFGPEPSMNSSNLVAFLATLDAGGSGIFTGPDPVANKVIRTGDTLFGSTVTAVNMSSFALNDAGQLAFFYTLANGRNGLAVANLTPVPEPSFCLAVAAAATGAVAAWRRRRAGRAATTVTSG